MLRYATGRLGESRDIKSQLGKDLVTTGLAACRLVWNVTIAPDPLSLLAFYDIEMAYLEFV
jgi:hypothetical protein